MFGFLLFSATLATALSQYNNPVTAYSSQQGQYYQRPLPPPPPQQQPYQEEPTRRPPPQILSHKQALSHDGNFKYAFASENGLLQGETISPDGSRTGAYEYVDPHGKKISVKYSAGKEGFKILEGAHIPRPVPHPQQVPHPGLAYPVQQAPRPQYAQERVYQQQQQQQQPPQQLQRYPNAPVQYFVPERRDNEIFQGADGAYRPKNKNEDYPDVEPGKPNSFGSGYTFEFGRN